MVTVQWFEYQTAMVPLLECPVIGFLLYLQVQKKYNYKCKISRENVTKREDRERQTTTNRKHQIKVTLFTSIAGGWKIKGFKTNGKIYHNYKVLKQKISFEF
jgi:hypothetical protein